MSTTAQIALDAGIGFGPGLAKAEPRPCMSESPGPAFAAGAGSDLGWIEKINSGDSEAASALLRRLYPTVMKVIRYRLPPRASEEDLAQIVFAKIFSKLHQFSGRVPLEHWVSRIVVNTCLTELRAETTRAELRMSDLSPEQEAVIEQLSATETELPGSSRQAARELVQKLLDGLTFEDRFVITLLHIEERSVTEICRITGWSRSATRVKAFRARRKMRSQLENILSQPARRETTVDEL